MILKNNKIIIVLNVIMLLIVTGLSTYAYHKQKSYSNQKIEINNKKEKDSRFRQFEFGCPIFDKIIEPK